VQPGLMMYIHKRNTNTKEHIVSTATHTLTLDNGLTIADALNAWKAQGLSITVNGRIVAAFGNHVASTYQNGSLSVSVKVRDRKRTVAPFTPLIVKVGQPITITIDEAI
jgi:hypothetical protein